MFNDFNDYYRFTRDVIVRTPMKITATPRSPFVQLPKMVFIKHTGLDRVLTLIARRFMYHDLINIHTSITVDSSNRSERINIAKRALLEWLSPKPQNKETLSLELRSSYDPKYGIYMGFLKGAEALYQKAVDEHAKAKKVGLLSESRTSLSEIQSLISEYPEYYKTITQPFFTINPIAYQIKQERSFTIDTILADALFQGPLTIYSVNFPENFVAKFNGLGFIKKKSAREDLKYLVAWYVIQREKNHNEYQAFNISEFELVLKHTQFRENYYDILKALSENELMGEDLGPNFAKRITFHSSVYQEVRIEITKEVL